MQINNDAHHGLRDQDFIQTAAFTSQSLPKKVTKKVFSLCEEKEDEDGIRTFAILAQSEDKEGLQKLMQAKIEKDEYGYIAENGVSNSGPYYFSTAFESSFVEYYIVEHDLLDRAGIEALLQTEEYDPTFRYPNNLREITLTAISSFAADNDYRGLNVEPVADALFADKKFRAYMIREGWTHGETIEERHIPHAILEVGYYLDALIDDHPDYFVEVGGLSRCTYPDNLRDLLFDSIYTVAREHHLPVTDAASLADKILLNPSFQSVCREYYSDSRHLQEGTALYQKAFRTCYEHVQNIMLPDASKEKQPSFQDQIKRAAEKKEHPYAQSTTAQKSISENQPER